MQLKTSQYFYLTVAGCSSECHHDWNIQSITRCPTKTLNSRWQPAECQSSQTSQLLDSAKREVQTEIWTHWSQTTSCQSRAATLLLFQLNQGVQMGEGVILPKLFYPRFCQPWIFALASPNCRMWYLWSDFDPGDGASVVVDGEHLVAGVFQVFSWLWWNLSRTLNLL